MRLKNIMRIVGSQSEILEIIKIIKEFIDWKIKQGLHWEDILLLFLRINWLTACIRRFKRCFAG